MISNTIYSKGRDNFKGYTFSAREWSAPTMVSPKEIRERIDSFALCGRKIKRMRLIGLSYFHTRDWVEEAAYLQAAKAILAFMSMLKIFLYLIGAFHLPLGAGSMSTASIISAIKSGMISLMRHGESLLRIVLMNCLMS